MGYPWRREGLGAYPWLEDDEGLGFIIGPLIQAGAALTTLAVTTSTTLYTQHQDRKFQTAQAAASRNLTVTGMVADLAIKDREMDLKEKQLDAEIALAEEEMAKLNAEREIQLQAARDQLAWIRAERERQTRIADAEAQVKISILDQQAQTIQNEGALREADYAALKEQLTVARADGAVDKQQVRAQREALSNEAMEISGAKKKSKTPLIVGAGVAAAAAAFFLMR